MKPLVINPLAEDDLAQGRVWYEQQSGGLGDEFLLSVGETFDRVQCAPELYAQAFLDLRLALVRRFPFAVIYRIDDDQITVVAVYHTSRDPRGWQDRA